MIFAFDFLSKPNLDINNPNWLPTWSLAAKWSLGLGRSMSMRWFCLGMYGSAFGVNSTSNPVFFLRLILEFKIFYMATDKYSNIKQNGGMKKFGYC